MQGVSLTILTMIDRASVAEKYYWKEWSWN